MKKIMAILLVMVMVLSLMPLAFAQDADQDVDETPTEEVVEETPVEETTEETPIEEVIEEETVEETTEEPAEEVVEETVEETTEETPIEEVIEEETVEISEEIIEEAGITPDSFLWELERAVEKIDLLLTFDEATEAQKELEYAKERLLEVQVMVSENKLDDAADAQEAHDELLEDVEETIEDMNGGGEEQLAEEVALEEQLNQHRMRVQKASRTMLKTKGLSTEQEGMAQAMFKSMAESADGAKLQIQVKKNKTKIKIKAAKGMTDEEISALEEQARAIGGEGADVKITGHKPTKAKKGVVEPSEAEEGENSAVTVEKSSKGKDKATEKGGKGKKK